MKRCRTVYRTCLYCRGRERSSQSPSPRDNRRQNGRERVSPQQQQNRRERVSPQQQQQNERERVSPQQQQNGRGRASPSHHQNGRDRVSNDHRNAPYTPPARPAPQHKRERTPVQISEYIDSRTYAAITTTDGSPSRSAGDQAVQTDTADLRNMLNAKAAASRIDIPQPVAVAPVATPQPQTVVTVPTTPPPTISRRNNDAESGSRICARLDDRVKKINFLFRTNGTMTEIHDNGNIVIRPKWNLVIYHYAEHTGPQPEDIERFA